MPKVDYDFDASLYIKDLSQYFAIEAAKLFNGRVCLYTDTLSDTQGKSLKVLRYAFVEITDGLYVDAYGSFNNAYNRLKLLFPEVNVDNIKGYSIEEVKAELKKMNVVYSNVEYKRNAREYLRNNLLTFRICYDARYYTFGIIGQIYNNIGKGTFLCYGITHELYNNEVKFGNMIHRINTRDFVEGIEYSYGFKKSENWYYKR